MPHSQRLDQRLYMLREEVKTMTQDKERGEQVWRDRLQRCQRQLKAKEEEMGRQCQYFENFKSQLQHKLSLARDREQNLQNRIYSLEKQLLDMTVSAATGITTISAVRITAGTATHCEEAERLPFMRGEGEGEEERQEVRRRQWQPRVGNEKEGGREGEKEKDTNTNEARLQGFILSLQADLRVLLEREEAGMTERRALMEQLQEAQENSHFLGGKVEEMKVEVHQLKLSESSLMEEVEELKEEKHRLQQILKGPADQTDGPGSSTLSCTTAMGPSSVGSSGEAHIPFAEGPGRPPSSAVPHGHHQAAAECMQNNTEDGSSFAKSEAPSKLLRSRTSPHFQPLSLTTEVLDEFKVGTWCSRGILNLEESPSEESDALREAYRSLGLVEDLESLQEQRDRLEVVLETTQEQLQMMAEENTRLKLQLRQDEQEAEAEHGSSREKIHTLPTSDGADNTILLQDDLAQALNQENRALGDRIQELLAHIELREEEVKREQTQLRALISKMESDRGKLELENQEQQCLITELTKKTEDDLNTIMELQHRLVESEQRMEESQRGKELCGSELQLEECVDSLVESMLKGEEPQQSDDLRAAAPHSQQNNMQTSLHVSSLTDQEDRLSKSVQSLKSEEEELSGCISSLKEQQREVAQSVQTQTEEKQLLTRTVWGLKVEKDSISQSVSSLKQEKEQLTRTVCGLKDEREQFLRTLSGLREEKESLSGLEREKEKLLEFLSSGKEERDEIMQSLQSLQAESDQLNQAVLYLKQERDELSDSLKCLKEQRDKEQSSNTSQEDHDKLMETVSSLKEDKERTERSIRSLKQEEKEMKSSLQGLREERNSLQAARTSQTQTEGRKTETAADNRDNSVQQQSDLMREVETLGEELKRTRDELDKRLIDIKRLRSELCQSESRREEAERKAARTADEVLRLTDAAYQMEETRKENEVKELQSKLSCLVREKTDALLQKAQIEEQYNILSAQLKAKTVALEELNSAYIALKRGRGSVEDVNAAVVSLRTRYNDIRAQYDALLKKRSQTDLETAPLKAKLSCLVVKCQERNSVLAQMMKMHRCGCVDSTLAQQVEQLLSDAALQDYTAAFTPGSNVKTRDHTATFTPGFISKFQDYTRGFTPDHMCSAPLVYHGFTPREVKNEKQASLVTTQSTTNLQDSRREVSPAAPGSSPVPTSPEKEQACVQVASSPVVPARKEGFNSEQLSLSADGLEKFGLDRSDRKGKSSPELTSVTRSSLSPIPLSSITRFRRLSSPEKIINLHEQLHKTLLRSSQAPVIRGRAEQPRKSLSFSAPADLTPASQTKKQSLSPNTPHTSPPPVTAAVNRAQHTPAVTPTNKPATLFNAVACRSADVAFRTNLFTHHHVKADTSKTPSNSPFASMSPCKEKSTSSSGTNTTTSPKPAQKIPAIPDKPDAKHTASPPSATRTTTFDSNVLTCSNPKTTASDTTAPRVSTAPEGNHLNTPSETDNAAPARHGLVFPASCTQPAHCSPKRSNRKSTAAAEKTARPKPGAPAEVRSVDVIQTVGQSSLMIGWERPPLDELGCSNGTFVYGYRVFVAGDFHKSVMSSACTKCILENVDLSVPLHISVQTLGSNGLSSDFVHTVYRT